MRKEIAVVGAGPAGSTAAEYAARSGADVILIERKMEIGTPVQCGGFIPEARELRELMPAAALPPALVDIPERLVFHRTRLQRLYSPSGRSSEFAVAGRSVDRRGLDRYLAYRAARAGAQIMPATRAIPATAGLILSGRTAGTVEAGIIIGADGPSSRLAVSLGGCQGRQDEPGVCLAYEMADVAIDPDAAEMYFGTRYAPGGYAWIIPQGGDLANVGVGIRQSYFKGTEGPAKIRHILDRFIANHPVAGEKLRRGEIVSVMRGLVPAGGMPPEIQRGNILIAGDAAGHVMATSGGGIPLAMVAGRIAGEVAAGYLRDSIDLGEYSTRIELEFGSALRSSVTIRRLIDLLMKSDRSMDLLFSMLDPDMMKSIQRGRIPAGLRSICEAVAGRLSQI